MHNHLMGLPDTDIIKFKNKNRQFKNSRRERPISAQTGDNIRFALEQRPWQRPNANGLRQHESMTNIAHYVGRGDRKNILDGASAQEFDALL